MSDPVADYLARGGTITRCPPAAAAETTGLCGLAGVTLTHYQPSAISGQVRCGRNGAAALKRSYTARAAAAAGASAKGRKNREGKR